jgi:pyridoxal phosphate enzyme (YggS family)
MRHRVARPASSFDVRDDVMVDAVLLEARLAAVRDRIERAASIAGRDPLQVRLVAVTKTHPVGLARMARGLGVEDLGENRVDELVAKQAEVDARWHLVGQLQRNKVRDVVGRADLIHSVDRSRLIDAVGRQATLQGRVQDILVQVNVGDDPAKGGCRLADVADLVSYAVGTPGVRVVGLMTVPPLPPAGVDPDTAARPLFRRLREVRDELRGSHPELQELSMGMSDDLESAVEEGATMIRIGSALFGPRGEAAR